MGKGSKYKFSLYTKAIHSQNRFLAHFSNSFTSRSHLECFCTGERAFRKVALSIKKSMHSRI